MSRLFPSSPVLEVDNITCCNRAIDEISSSSSDDGVIYTGRMSQVMRQILQTWPTNQHVDVHVRPTAAAIMSSI